MGFHYFNPHGAFGFKNFFCSDWHYGSWWGKHRPPREKKESTIEASLLGTFDSGLGEGSAEIVAHDADSQRLFVTNSITKSVDILDISDPKNPTKVGSIDVNKVNGAMTGGPNSVAVSHGLIAIAVEAETVTDAGLVAFYDVDGNFLGSVDVGPLPDMLTFNEAGTHLVVANEGQSAGDENEPDALPNPNGSVSIIEVDKDTPSNSNVTTLDFTDSSITFDALKDLGVRVNTDAPSAAADLEPEYVTIEGNKAFISLQENNAVAVIEDITNPSAFTIDDILPLGTKDHSRDGNGLDASNRDGGINIDTYDIKGLYQPDGLASYTYKGKTYFVGANEGDGRDVDESRGADLVDGDLSNGEIDVNEVSAELQAQLADDALLGRLKFSNVDGDIDGDGLIEELHSFGARSFAIWDEDGKLVFDSGDMIAEITADLTPELFNANDGDPGEFDERSDDKGAEPESVVIGEVDGKTYAFVGLERSGGGVMIFDITRPKKVEFVQYIRTEGDIAPEGLDFISAKDSPIGVPMLAVANEVSGTTSLYQINFEGKTIKGTNKSEKLVGTAGDDDISGRGGNDLIFGLAGNDDLEGDRGRDKIFGGFGDDHIDGGRHNDMLFGEEGDDNIDGGRGNDDIEGGDGDDEIDGGRGNDDIDGGAGNDDIDGGRGHDDIDGGDGDDDIDGGSGNDDIDGGDGNDDIDGGSGNDDLKGGDGDDRMTGGRGNDEHDGGEGKDTVVFSGNRDDYLVDIENGVVIDLRNGRPDGIDEFKNVEFLEFKDQTIDLFPEATFTLQLLHASDLEGGLDAIARAANFAAIVEQFETEFENTVIISGGDNWIPSPFFNAAGDAGTFNPLFEGFYNEFFGLIDLTQVDPSADTNGDGFFDNSELDAFIIANNLNASDVYTTDINGDGFPDYFEEIDNSEGRADISIMNIIGFDASALGNHEFDVGSDALENIINYDSEEGNSLSGVGVSSIVDEFGGNALNFLQEVDWPGALFPYLSANLDFSGDGDLGSLFTSDILPNTDFISDLLSAREPLPGSEGDFPQVFETAGDVPDSNDDKIAPATIIEQGGEFIGVVGATTQLLESLSSPTGTTVVGGPFADNDMAQLASVLQPIIDDLIAGDPGSGREPVNKIILTSHLQQIALETELAGLLKGVDIIIAAGSDTILADGTDRLRPGDVAADGYPVQTTDANNDPVLIVSTNGEYSYVGRLVVEFDADGKIILDSLDENINGPYVTDDQGVLDVTGETDIDTALANSKKATDVSKITDAVQDVVIATDSNVFGETDVFIDGVRGSVRTEETNMGNLTADANLAAAQSVDDTVLVSIKNGGGIRAPIGEVDSSGNELPPQENPLSGKETGEISQLDIENTLRFNNALTLITLTPEQLLQVLEHAVSATAPGATPGQFAQVGGINFSFDPNAPAGSRIESAAIVDESGNKLAIVQDGSVVDAAPSAIRIVTLNFLADGGDGYPFDDFVAADPTFANRVDMNTLDPTTIPGALDGNADFAGFGTEQDALAEFLVENHPVADGSPDGPSDFNAAETEPEFDERIQNLGARADTVLDGATFPGAQLVINEIRIDQPGTDNDEYFELFGEANLSLDGYTYVVIGDGPGGSGVVEAAIDLTGQSLDANGYFVAAEGSFSLGTADLTTVLDFENSDNVTHLLVRDFTGAVGDDLDTNDDGTPETAPWSEVVDSVALVEDPDQDPGADDLVYSDTVVGPDGQFVPGHVFRSPDSGEWQIGEFDDGVTDTPGAANPEPLDLAIFDIQGAGHRSPHEGALVRTSGIVTAIAATGFYLQDPTGDGDIATSDGIFILGDITGLAVGDAVEVQGTVEEQQFGSNLSLTRIDASSTNVTSSGNTLPDTVVLGVDRIQPNDNIDDDGLASFDPETDAIDFLESLEGMRVEVNDPLVVAGTSRFDEVALVANRGSESGPGILNEVVSDGDFNPEILLTDDVLVTEPNATTGDTFAENPVGVLDYTFGAYKLQLTETPTVVSGGRVQEMTSLAGDDEHLTIATYNAFNLDPGDGDPGGAADRLDALAESIVNALGSPDIISLQEIQDSSGTTDDGVTSATLTLQELAQAIFLAGGPFYSFASIDPVDGADGGQPGANIQNAFLYNADRVSLDFSTLTRIEDDAFEENGDGTPAEAAYEGTRKPLVGEFTFLPTGESVTVVGNHLKSKSQDDGLFGENQPPVQNTLDQRVDQASVINDFVAGIIAGDPDANVIVLGDMNDFQFSDTLDAMKNGNGGDAELVNLIDTLPTEDQYTFIFNGNSQVLDHILVSDNLAADAEVDIVHTNLDYGFPSDNPSDHDPIVARIDLSDDMMTT